MNKLYLLISLFLLSPTTVGLAQLTWPLAAPYEVKGTFGDSRGSDVGFHGGVDIHKAGNSPVKPVKSGTLHDFAMQTPGRGWTMQTVLKNSVGDTIAWYSYQHVNIKMLDDSTKQWDWFNTIGEPIDNHLVNGAFTTVFDWPEDWQDHLHLAIKDAGGNWTDPIYEGNTDNYRLDYEDTNPPTIEAVAYYEYHGPNDTNNRQHSWSDIPGNTKIDIIAYIHDRDSGSDWDKKVGVNEIYWAVTDGTATPTNNWNKFVVFSSYLPGSSAIDVVYARDDEYCGVHQVHTYHSGESADHVDKMWYIITNSDGHYNYSQDYGWTTPNAPTQIEKYVHIKALDSAGKDVPYCEKVYIKNRDGIEELEPELPESYALLPNYPNPFNLSTCIHYELPERSQVKLTILNSLGQEVTDLVKGVQKAGKYDISWSGRDSSGREVSSGIYFVAMEATYLEGHNSFSTTAKLTLVK